LVNPVEMSGRSYGAPRALLRPEKAVHVTLTGTARRNLMALTTRLAGLVEREAFLGIAADHVA
jgi:hypothetical protein